MSFIFALKLKVYVIINTRTKYHTAIKHLPKLINLHLTWRLFVRIWLHITSDSITIFVCKSVCVKRLSSAGFNLLN